MITLEQLQKLSDTELDDLAAVAQGWTKGYKHGIPAEKYYLDGQFIMNVAVFKPTANTVE